MLDRKYLIGVLTGTGLGFLIANWIVARVSTALAKHQVQETAPVASVAFTKCRQMG
jgi:hypothetical protein